MVDSSDARVDPQVGQVQIRSLEKIAGSGESESDDVGFTLGCRNIAVALLVYLLLLLYVHVCVRERAR